MYKCETNFYACVKYLFLKSQLSDLFNSKQADTGEEKYVCFYLLILVKIVFFTQMSCVGSQGHKITNNFFEEESAIFCRFTLVCFSLVNSKLILVH